MSPIEQTTSSPLRVLVVENDPEWRRDHVKNLNAWGYRHYVAVVDDNAPDKFQALWDDAIDKARRHRCHLALVDMRLKRDDDDSDTSGLKLVTHLAPAVSIIVSNYGDRKTVRDALKSPPDVPERAYDFVGKEDGPEAMQKAIEEAVKDHWPRLIKGEIERIVDWSHSIPDSAQLIQRFFPDDSEVPQDEIEELLWKLYPDATKLSVQGLESADRTPSTSLSPRSIVIRVKEGDKTHPDIVKIARAERSMDEFEKYRNHVDRKFPQRYYAKLLSMESLWDVRGAKYEHVGNWGKMTLFSTYYRSRSSKDVCAVVEKYGRDWQEHYSKTRASKENSVFRAFTEVWEENWVGRLRQSIGSLSAAPADFQDWFTNALGLDDPIVWLRKRVGMAGTNTHDESPSNVPTANLHGDLQGDNCFVDEENHNLWLIDFERSGPGPIVEDWVELEVDILTRLSCFSTQDRQDYLELAAYITSPNAAALWQPTSLATSFSEAVKALAVIQEVRKYARRTTGLGDNLDDTRLYRWALLLNVAFRLTLPTGGSVEEEAKCNLSIAERCLLLGGVICYSLNAKEETWPPPQWGLPDSSKQRQDVSDLELEITLANNNLTYELNGAGRYTRQFAGQISLSRSSEDILRGTIDRLSNLARKSPQKLAANEVARYQEDLSDIGYYLYDELIPGELRREYESFVRKRSSRSLLIVSDDPWTPWEIVKPQVDEIGDPFLCESFHSARWLPGSAPPTNLVLGKAMIVAPPDNLRAAQREQEYLASLSKSTPLARNVVSVATVSEVLNSFRKGDAGLYHFACHGNLDRTDPNESKLKLKDGSLRASQLVGDKQTGLRKARPVIFLNACHSGALGYGLTRLGGWAQRFVKSGASAFIGTLWEVNDELAADFAIEFYDRLLGLNGHQPMAIAHALHDARLVIKQQAPGNPTWLAYVLYGDPNARAVESVVR